MGYLTRGTRPDTPEKNSTRPNPINVRAGLEPIFFDRQKKGQARGDFFDPKSDPTRPDPNFIHKKSGLTQPDPNRPDPTM